MTRSANNAGFISSGCLIAFLIFAAIVILGVTYGIIQAKRLIIEYTDERPLQLEEVVISQAELDEIMYRIAVFTDNFQKGSTSATLVLSESEVNALICNLKELEEINGQVKIDFTEGKMNGTVSFPVSSFIPGLSQERYVNGEVSFNVFARNGVLVITVDSLAVKGEQLPEAVLEELRGENLVKELYGKAEYAEILHQIRSVEIKDEQIWIVTQPPGTQT
jgi:hypothetical protein